MYSEDELPFVVRSPDPLRTNIVQLWKYYQQYTDNISIASMSNLSDIPLHIIATVSPAQEIYILVVA